MLQLLSWSGVVVCMRVVKLSDVAWLPRALYFRLNPPICRAESTRREHGGYKNVMRAANDVMKRSRAKRNFGLSQIGGLREFRVRQT
jgi:hypothetical protein